MYYFMYYSLFMYVRSTTLKNLWGGVGTPFRKILTMQPIWLKFGMDIL